MDAKKKPVALLVTVSGVCPLSSTFVHARVMAMLKKAGVKQGSLSIVFLTDKNMRMLNRQALGHDYVTDVITFDLSESHGRPTAMIDGEIYVCPSEAKRNAAQFKEPFEREVLRYAVHGILHLLGHDDASDAERQLMHNKENSLLPLR